MNSDCSTPNSTSSGDRGIEVCYVHKNAQRIPDWIIYDYASTAEILDLSHNALATLYGIDSLVRLRHLVLDSNGLEDVNIFYTCSSRLLETLSLNKNSFLNIEFLVSSINRAFPKIRHLSLLGNPCCPDQLTRPQDQDREDYICYRLYVISQLPFLDFLDCSKISPQERNRARQIGQFQVIPVPRVRTYNRTSEDQIPRGLHPLPSLERENRGRPAFGTRKYHYLGNHSEGNRFIKDKQL